MANTFLKDFIIGELVLQGDSQEYCSRRSTKTALIAFIELNGFELDSKKYKEQDDISEKYNKSLEAKKDFVLNFFDKEGGLVKMVCVQNPNIKKDPFLFIIETSKNRITEFSRFGSGDKNIIFGTEITSISDTPEGNIYISSLKIPYFRSEPKEQVVEVLAPDLKINLFGNAAYEVAKSVYEGFEGGLVGRKLDVEDPEALHSAVKEITEVVEKEGFSKIKEEGELLAKPKLDGGVDKGGSIPYEHIPSTIDYYNKCLNEFINHIQDLRTDQTR